MHIAEPFETGVVTISLDTELGWGRIDSGRFKDIEERLDHGSAAINRLLDAFNEYSVPGTWALVGQLLRADRATEDNIGFSLPVDRDSIPWNRDWWRASNLIEEIIDSTVDHEIACHSGTHIPYDRLTRSEAIRDIKSFREWQTASFDQDVTSFIFPQNRIDYLDVLQEYDFQCFRGRPPYLGSDPLPTAFRPRLENGLVNIPASVAYRHYYGRHPLLRALPNGTKVAGMKAAVVHAAKRGRVCHVVLHPKDFTRDDGLELLDGFRDWLQFVAKKREAGKIEVRTMAEIAAKADFHS